MDSPFKQLENILNNKTSGSSDIMIKLNKLLRNNYKNDKFVSSAVSEINKKLLHFSAIREYISMVSKLTGSNKKKEFLLFLNNIEEKLHNQNSILYYKAIPYIKDINNILTISNSGTLLRLFENWRKDNNKLKITVCESRPKLEGRIFAKTLLKKKIKTELITDFMAGSYVPLVDAVITGADSVLLNGNIVNKTGSKTLALLCRHYKKPFYVITLKNKFTTLKTFNPPKENPDEIWNIKNGNLRIQNIYFEIVERDLITAVISD